MFRHRAFAIVEFLLSHASSGVALNSSFAVPSLLPGSGNGLS